MKASGHRTAGIVLVDSAHEDEPKLAPKNFDEAAIKRNDAPQLPAHTLNQLLVNLRLLSPRPELVIDQLKCGDGPSFLNTDEMLLVARAGTKQHFTGI
jgi:hypothetical protein